MAKTCIKSLINSLIQPAVEDIIHKYYVWIKIVFNI